jgi:hypothetical protein
MSRGAQIGRASIIGRTSVCLLRTLSRNAGPRPVSPDRGLWDQFTYRISYRQPWSNEASQAQSDRALPETFLPPHSTSARVHQAGNGQAYLVGREQLPKPQQPAGRLTSRF